jgi:hypothetical protein
MHPHHDHDHLHEHDDPVNRPAPWRIATSTPTNRPDRRALARLDRRAVLRAGAVTVALPMLDLFRVGESRTARAAAEGGPRRLMLVSYNLGFHAPFLFPEKPGRDYEQTRYLKLLEPMRGKFTIFSGISHPRWGAHGAEVAIFTGVAPERFMSEGSTVSLDQFVAERIGQDTRFRNLVIGSGPARKSWTELGQEVPGDASPTKVFASLFIDGSADDVEKELRRIAHGRSILDRVREESRSLSRALGPDDKRRVDLLFASVRDAERALARQEAWVTKPKPKVDFAPPAKDPTRHEVVERDRLWFDITRLALATDSTRVVMLALNEVGVPKLPASVPPELIAEHHDCSHHGQDETKIAKLAVIEETQMAELNRFLESLAGTAEGGTSLLDRTVVATASNLGNASAHSGTNLPIIVAGGGLAHAGHVAYDRKNNVNLSNLYVRLIQQLGIEADRFGTSDGIVTDV